MIFGPATIEIIIGALILAVVVLLILVIRLEFRLRAFTRGKSGASLEDSIAQFNKMLERLFSHTDKIGKSIEEHDKRLKKSIQSVSTIRFNPFAGDGQGSNQSFATAFLSEDGDGVIISSLYSRDKVRIFAKPVKGNVSEHELSQEEKEALKQARVS